MCQALTKAVPHLDVHSINRLLVDNCGVTDASFAAIVNGLAQLSDFKSIVYKLNSFGLESARAL